MTKDEIPISEDATLKITSKSLEKSLDETEEDLGKFDEGEDIEIHEVNIVDKSKLRSLLTDTRMEILDSLINEGEPSSIRDLARRLDRDVSDVHDDLKLLERYDIVEFRQEGRSKVPFVPYSSVKIEVEIGKDKASQ